MADDIGLIAHLMRRAGFGASRAELEARAAKGAPGNPATLDDLCAKYERCVVGRLNKNDAKELREILVHLDECEDLGRLFALLGSAGTRVH